MPSEVLRFADLDRSALAELLGNYGLELVCGEADEPIPGSYWGDCEAGLIGNSLHLRADTPLHSILHESSHYICMDAPRRAALDTDAGSDDAEENAVCYLQVLLAERLPDCSRGRIFADMDAWGYSFRLGNTRAWFEQDAEDAYNWLISMKIIDQNGRLSLRLRD